MPKYGLICGPYFHVFLYLLRKSPYSVRILAVKERINIAIILKCGVSNQTVNDLQLYKNATIFLDNHARFSKVRLVANLPVLIYFKANFETFQISM